MPYVMVEPDVHLEHGDVTVFCTYSDGDYNFPCQYWFTTNPDNADRCYSHGTNGHFDARMFAGKWSSTPTAAQWDEFWKPRFKTERECVDALIRDAIKNNKVRAAVEVRPAKLNSLTRTADILLLLIFCISGVMAW